MNQSDQEHDCTTPPRVTKQRFLVVLSGLVLLLAVAGFLLYPAWANFQHQRLIRRFSAHVMAAMAPLNAHNAGSGGMARGANMSLADRTRWEALKAINTAVWNVLYYRQKCSPEKLRALVDRLDATSATELQNYEDCLRLMNEVEGVCPGVHDYVWFTSFREMQDDGTVARLPVK